MSSIKIRKTKERPCVVGCENRDSKKDGYKIVYLPAGYNVSVMESRM